MGSTNDEEESSVAAYGLVALCDQSYDTYQTQFPEEVVETTTCTTTGEHLPNNNNLNIVHSLENGSPHASSDVVVEMEVQGSECAERNQLVVDVLDMVLPKVYDTSSKFSQGECSLQMSETEGNSFRRLQLATNENEGAMNRIQIIVDNNGVVNLPQHESATENETACYMVRSLSEVDLQSCSVLTNEDVIVDGIKDQEQDDNKVDFSKQLLSYTDNMFDGSNYTPTTKSRQGLLREAVEWRMYVRLLLEKGCSEGANFYESEVLTLLKSMDNLDLKTEIFSRISEKDMLQPAVQFWDFGMIYKIYGDKKPLHCPSCSMSLYFVPFGQRFALRMLYDIDRPILLATSFLRCTSKGKKQHEILGYDPRLLRMFRNLDLPFMLFHKAGITKAMLDFIVESMIGGMTVNRLFDVIKAKYEAHHTVLSQFFVDEIDAVHAHIISKGGQIAIDRDELLPPYVNCHPSKALLGRCFVAALKEKDEYYRFCLQQVLANECIILDDSMDVESCVGYSGLWGNTASKVFPAEYQRMFLIFNETKYILSWCFLKDCKFSEVQNILVELKNRHMKENVSLKACFTTRCCEWRDDLRKIFGKWFIVKGNLRLFVDRICKEMTQDHAYYQDCVSDLFLVFRQLNDTCDIRREYTADPVVIAHKLQEFVKRWKDVLDDRVQPVLTNKAISLLTDLAGHVQAGCLSAIPPEVGEDNFTDIHDCLLKAVSHCKINTPLVSALFSMCLHGINTSRGVKIDLSCKLVNKMQTPSLGERTIDSEILPAAEEEGHSTVSIQTENREGFFIPVVPDPPNVEKHIHLPAATLIQMIGQHYSKQGQAVPNVLLQSLMYYKYEEDFDAFAPQAITNLRLLPYYSSALNLISHSAFPKEAKVYDERHLVIGLKEIEMKIRHLQVDTINFSNLSGSTSDLFPIIARQLIRERMCDNLSANTFCYERHLIKKDIQIVDMKEKDLISLLKRHINFPQDAILECMKSGLVLLDGNKLKVSSSVLGEISTPINNNNTGVPSAECLNTESCFTDSLDQGDCVHSVVDQLSSTPTDKTNELKAEEITHELADVICNVETNEGNLVIKESLDDVKPSYVGEGEITDETVTEFSENKLTDLDQGVCDFEVLQKLANALGAVITLVTSLQHCWVIPIFPETFCTYSPHFFVAYRYQRFFPAWLAHRASVSSIRNINLKRQGKEPQCRCGRGTPARDGEGKCVSKEGGKYITRCMCFRLDHGCTDLCDCRNCENPFGVRPLKLKSKSKIPFRQRYAHEAAKTATCKSSSVSTNIATQTSSCTEQTEITDNMDNWVSLEHCIFEALINNINTDENVVTPLEVQEKFNSVVLELLSIPELGPVVQTKTLWQVSLKLQQREQDVSEYLKMYQMQVDASLR